MGYIREEEIGKRFLIEVVHYIKLRKVIYSTDVDIL
jgi:hypothetical protein